MQTVSFPDDIQVSELIDFANGMGYRLKRSGSNQFKAERTNGHVRASQTYSESKMDQKPIGAGSGD